MSIGGSSEPENNSGRRKVGRPLDAAKRSAIVHAAAHHFFHHGYAATAIEQVASDAGVSKVTIYNQFGDKRALFAAAVESECEKMRGHFSMDAMPQGTIRERLTAIGQAIFAFLFRPEMMQFERRIAAETEVDPAIGAAFLEAGPRRMKQAFGAWLAHAVEAGELVIPDPMLAAEQFVSMCKGMGDLERRFGAEVCPAQRDHRIAGAVDVFLAAYGTHAARAQDR
ncbi:TetR/AcrR family transcriptional regulator [Porphyrobacter sp. ULC335]|uniref:TetR/AcrR family transcriptional regulator n=1 Tax=Porphyrobacter sp. ULC335 TaxID=2854260 RepID=UPI00221E53C3|nr:TetR/AcrR family transcriptional regulator [Porphyrobacter sp. ULC335]UYV15841.1 TetR/AcrR family transcriptional regulator [Porphyrobacter sp. ULC335]